MRNICVVLTTCVLLVINAGCDGPVIKPANAEGYRTFTGRLLYGDSKTPIAETRIELCESNFYHTDLECLFSETSTDHCGKYCFVIKDSRLLRQALRNRTVVVNIKHVPKGFTLTAEISDQPDRTYILVADDGTYVN